MILDIDLFRSTTKARFTALRGIQAQSSYKSDEVTIMSLQLGDRVRVLPPKGSVEPSVSYSALPCCITQTPDGLVDSYIALRKLCFVPSSRRIRLGMWVWSLKCRSHLLTIIACAFALLEASLAKSTSQN